jgi:hypothetical protein
MAPHNRASACTFDSFQETGITTTDKFTGTDGRVRPIDELHHTKFQAPGTDYESTDHASYSEKRVSICDERELEGGDAFGTPDDQRTQDSTTYTLPCDDSHKTKKEKPKKVSTRRRRWALYYLLRFHVPSLVVTLFLMVLYCRSWIWHAPGPSNEMRNALQFAAKIHEGLIIMSLTNIVLHRLRFLLLQGQGVPLGLLSSPFQLATPLYFMTLEFWGAVGASLNGVAGISTVLLVGVSLILAMAIGPFSAIVMLPSDGLWNVPRSYPGMAEYLDPSNDTTTLFGGLIENLNVTQHALSFVAALSPQDLYPTVLGPGLGVTWSCPDQPMLGKDSYGCRSIFNLYFSNIIKKIPELVVSAWTLSIDRGLPSYEDYVQWMATANMTQGEFQSVGTVWFAWKDYAVAKDANADMAMATTPAILTSMASYLAYDRMHSIFPDSVDDVYQRLEYSTRNGTFIPMKQPAVITQCARAEGYSWNNFTAGAQVRFANGLFPGFDLTVDDTMVELVRNCSHRQKDGCLTYVDIQEHVPHPISTAVFVVNTLYDRYANVTGAILVQVCVVSARWAEAEVWAGFMDQENSQEDWGTLTQDPVALINATEHVEAAEIIRIDAGWMNGLDRAPYIYDTNSEMLSPTALSHYDYFAAYCGTSVGQIPGGVSLMIASALANVQCAFTPCFTPTSTSRVVSAGTDFSVYNFTRLRTNEEAEAAGGDDVHVRISYFIHTYGYGVRDSWLTAVGIAVLLFHAALVLVHVGLILGGGYWTSDAWGSLGELVALALRSAPPSGLANATAGVSKAETWQLIAVVRERVAENRLEFVLSERGARRRRDGDVEKGAGGEEGAHGEFAVPISDKKYG